MALSAHALHRPDTPAPHAAPVKPRELLRPPDAEAGTGHGETCAQPGDRRFRASCPWRGVVLRWLARGAPCSRAAPIPRAGDAAHGTARGARDQVAAGG